MNRIVTEPLLEIQGLFKTFDVGSRGLFNRKERLIHATNDVNLKVGAGQTVGLVGESGSGKSTLGRLVLRLTEPTNGDIRFEGKSILGIKGKELHRYRQKVQMVFQDPYGSLNPRMNVSSLISEGWIVSPELKPANPSARIGELMEQVGLRPEWSNRFPSQFSGGQRQRIGIARALSVNPKLLVCDEAVSALDVSVQAQILRLLKEIQKETGIAYLFISHDLSVVRNVSHQVAVMYLGRVIEYGDSDQIYRNPVHPYTQSLLASVPRFGGNETKNIKPVLRGEPPDPSDPPSGCMFRNRCWREKPECAVERPVLDYRNESHLNACHFPGK